MILFLKIIYVWCLSFSFKTIILRVFWHLFLYEYLGVKLVPFYIPFYGSESFYNYLFKLITVNGLNCLVLLS